MKQLSKVGGTISWIGDVTDELSRNIFSVGHMAEEINQLALSAEWEQVQVTERMQELWQHLGRFRL